MSENPTSNVWLWKDPDKRWLSKVLKHIKSSDSADNEIIPLKCEDINDFDAIMSLTKYLFDLSLKFKLFDDEQTMFLNLKDTITAIELCLDQQKQKNVSGAITDEEVIDFYNKYANSFKCESSNNVDKCVFLLKKFFKQSNCIDVWLLLEKCQGFKNNSDINNHIKGYKYLLLGTPTSLILKELISTLFGQELFNISVGIPLDASLHGSPTILAMEKIKVITECMNLCEISQSTQPGFMLGSATEEYIQDTILAFLSLLINSRNELALSKAMISPIIDLSHEAFTTLKHQSTEKDMPMCQVAISYVTRIRLGGKGYAPPTDCPMLPHLKGFEQFVDTLNQMQTIVEEDSKPISAVTRLINVLKKKLLKCDSDRIKDSSVETVAGNLQSTLLTLSKARKCEISSSNTQVCQEALDVLYHFVNFVNSNYFSYDPKIALEKKHMKRTPLNLPPLLGYFRSPEDESSCDTRSSLNEDSILSRSSLIQRPTFPSYFHQSESSEVSASCVNSSTPSKLTFKDILCEKENNKNENKVVSVISLENKQEHILAKKNRKRSILSEITNENVNKSEINCKNEAKKSCKMSKSVAKENVNEQKNKKQPKKETKKLAKKFKQIQGQGKITSFFIMGRS